MTEEQKYELIEKSLKGELTPAEQAELDELRNSDSNFESEVEAVRQSLAALETLPLLEFSKKIKEAEGDYLGKERNTNYLKGGLISVLAIGVVTTAAVVLSDSEMEEAAATNVVSNQGVLSDTAETRNDEPIVVVHVDHEGNATHVLEPSNVAEHKDLDTVYHRQDTSTQHIRVIEKPDGLVLHDSVPVIQYTHEVADAQENDEEVADNTPKPCPHIVFGQELNAACLNEGDGEIRITNISGGNGPYEIKLDDGDFDQERSITDLYAGAYVITIKDADNCSAEVAVELEEEDCRISFVFSPNYEDVWKIPAPAEYYTFTLLSETGAVLYKKEYASEENTWDGLGANGQAIPQGVYVFLIEYEGKVKKGELNIVIE